LALDVDYDSPRAIVSLWALTLAVVAMGMVRAAPAAS